MPEATNGDVTIYFEDEGLGPPVFLLHGHTLDRRLWNPVTPMLLQAGLRAIRMDLRGHGLSSRPDFGFCDGAHSSRRPDSCISAVQFCGSMLACDTNG